MPGHSNKARVLLYGDQTVEKLPSIRAVFTHARSCDRVKRFLQDACDIVRTEIAGLRPDERANVRDFASLLELAEDNAKRDEPNEIVATILMGVARLAEMVFMSEKDPSILGSMDAPTNVLGLCTGEIAAAIPASAKDITHLYSLSVEAVGIFCRFARAVIRRSLLVDSSNDSWATTLVGKSAGAVQKILDEFHRKQNVPSLRHISIGFVAQGWVTLFGPPQTTQRLFAWSKELDEVARIPTDARGGVHMPNLPKLDLDEILGSSSSLDVQPFSNTIMWSPYTSQPRCNGSIRALLQDIISDTAQEQMLLGETIASLTEHLDSCKWVTLDSAGTTPHLPILQKAFVSHGVECITSKTSARDSGAGRDGTNRFAIVGMSGRFPGSESVSEYWQSLLDGERFIREIPDERFNLDKWFDPSAKQKNATVNRSGAFLDRPGAFDNRLFNMSPREAFQADPLHRLFLTVCYEALEKAGYSPDSTPSTQSNRIATYFGQTSDDWRDLLLTKGVDIYYAPGICRAFGPSRVNYHFKWGGPSYGIDSACASSITAISLACASLASRECDTALAGGGSILNSPAPFAGLSRGGFLSQERGCETFHQEADGYVRGEGTGVVILKRLDDAIAENDNILGVIAGAGRNYSSDASSISHPSPEAQQRLYRQVLHQSGTDPTSIGYVEMHGTGTQAGDAAEMSSVVNTFTKGRGKDNPLVVGAVKANIGHGEAAAGVCALIKACMVLKEGKIPPQPGMPFQINPRLPDLSRVNTHIAADNMSLQADPKGDGTKRIFLNSFDASGGNSCLLLEAPPTKMDKMADPRQHHVITFSARTPKALQGTKQRYLDFLKSHPDTSIADLAYSTTARRMHSTLRNAFTSSSITDLTKQLEASCNEASAGSPPKPGPIIFAFTGQGSQYSGMGQQLWKNSHQFRHLIESYQALATNLELPSFIDLIARDDIDMTTIDTTPIQLAVVAVEIAVSKLWISWGIQPEMVIGHSLGEYATLCIAGVLTVSDTFALVGRRAQMIASKIPANQAAMLAIPKAADEVEKILSSSYPSCEISCRNAPQSTVVSGSAGDLDKLKTELQDQKTRSHLLRVPYGFHSAQLDPILAEYQSFASGIDFSAPEITVASTLLGRIVGKGEKAFSADYLRRQMREPVNFVGAVEAARTGDLVRNGSLFVEVGPDPVCLGLLRANLAAGTENVKMLPTLRREEDNWSTISSSISALYDAGITPNWTEYHRDFTNCLSLLDLPTYAFDEKDFWEPYPDPGADEPAQVKQIEQPSKKGVPGFPTSSLQVLAKETKTDDGISVTFESFTSEPNLLAAIRGHSVAGVTIVSSSIFGDMALSAARYACERLEQGQKTATTTIRKLEIHHPVVITDDRSTSQVIQVEAQLDKKNSEARVHFRCKTEGASFKDIGECEIQYTHEGKDIPGWQNDLSRRKLLIGSRIDALRSGAESGPGHKLQRPVIYQLFNSLVEYGSKFQGLEEVAVDENFRDAVGRVKLPVMTDNGSFLYSPYLLDVIVHLAGFLANCGLRYPADIAFLATGFDAWHLLQPLSSSAVYTSYASLEESSDGSLLVGDVYVLEGDQLVSVLSGLRFQKMKKAALPRILLGAAPAQKTTRFAPKPQEIETVDSNSSTEPSSPGSSTPGTPASGISTPASSVDDGPALKETLLSAVASEAQVDESELQPDIAFADLGLDSLMAITIIASLRQETGVELPGSFFLDNQTVAEAIEALPEDEGSGAATPIKEESKLEVPSDGDSGDIEVNDDKVEDAASSEIVNEPAPKLESESKVESVETSSSGNVSEPTKMEHKIPAARALLLHGSAEPSKTLPVFILPDATGSVGAYSQLPPLAASRRLYGLESPFARREPSEIRDVGVTGLAKSFADGIRETQTDGPYLLAGCSTGATFAFETARVLIEEGQSVQGLLLAGAAPSQASEELVQHSLTAEQVEECGLLGGSKKSFKPPQQKEHAAAVLQTVLQHDPRQLPSGQSVDKITVVAPSSAMTAEAEQQTRSPEATALLTWYYANWSRSDRMGWEDYFDTVSVQTLDSDYSSMTSFPQIDTLGSVIDKAVGEMVSA